MTMLTTLTAGARRLGGFAWQVASLPPALAHEAAHLLLAAPWAERTALVMERDGGMACQVDWQDDTPGWAKVLAFSAPMLLGAVAGVVGLVHLATHGTPDNTLLAAAIAAYWVMFVAPSAQDIRGATSGATDADADS